MIGPPHGTKTRPRLAPSRKPPPRSLPGLRRLSRARGRSSHTPNCGMIRLAATMKSSAIERLRRKSCGRWSWRSSHVAISVKVAKLTTSPAMIAYGLRRPPVAPPAKRIGSTGNTHGEIAVTMPAAKAIGSRMRKRPSMPMGAVLLRRSGLRLGSRGGLRLRLLRGGLRPRAVARLLLLLALVLALPLGLRLALLLALAAPAARAAARGLRRRQGVGERVGDLLGRAGPLA